MSEMMETFTASTVVALAARRAAARVRVLRDTQVAAVRQQMHALQLLTAPTMAAMETSTV
jgi:hypothetical protein